jgi:hypothetical protein
MLRDRSRRMNEVLSTYTSVHADITDLRRREYFFDRVVLECQRSRETTEAFAIVVIRVSPAGNQPPKAKQIEQALAALQPKVREYDCLSLISPYEIGVLALGVGAGEDAPAFTEMLRNLVAESSANEDLTVGAGYAVYGRGATDAGAMLGKARASFVGRTSEARAGEGRAA